MHAHLRAHRFALSLLVCASLSAPALRGASWPALDPAERAATTPAIDPDASVEILTHETTIDDSDRGGTTSDHYFRIKVFNKAGVDKLAKIEIPFDRNNASVTDIEARTIKPDGSILELKKADVFERDVVKVGNIRHRVKSFAPPGLEPGVIVEYRFRLSSDTHGWMFPLLFQADSPTRSVRYRFKPIDFVPNLSMQVLYLNYPQKELKAGRDGFYEFTATSLHAFKEEPMSPPAVHLASSVVIYYTFETAKTPELYWAEQSERLFRDTKTKAKATKPIVAQAQRLVAPADSVEEKLASCTTTAARSCKTAAATPRALRANSAASSRRTTMPTTRSRTPAARMRRSTRSSLPSRAGLASTRAWRSRTTARPSCSSPSCPCRLRFGTASAPCGSTDNGSSTTPARAICRPA